MLALLSVEGYAASAKALNLAKPEIQRVSYYSNEWHITYQDVQTGTGYVSENVYIDNVYDRLVYVGNHETRGYKLKGGPYDPESCHEVKIDILDAEGNVVVTSDVFKFGDLSKCVASMGKPVINKVKYHNGKWQILYKDIAVSDNLGKEVLFVDGVINREVIAGTKAPQNRGFYLAPGNYAEDSCHTAYIVTYDNAHNILSTSDVFYFGNTNSCNNLVEESDVTDPVVTVRGVTPQIIKAGEAYVELGATANDNKDGDITNNIVIDTSSVDTTTEGNYTVTYTAIDAAGNDSSAVRKVEVVSPSYVDTAVINSIKYHGGKWHIHYSDIKVTPNLTTEELVVDGNIDRTVVAGINSYDGRGFPLHGEYAQGTCHDAYIIIRDSDGNEVLRTETFTFGCN